MAGNLPRERWMRPPVMTKEEVDSWIANRKSFYSSTYDDLLIGRSSARAELADPRVPVHYRVEAIKNHDLITARLEELLRNEKIGNATTDKARVIALENAYRAKTGQDGDRKLGPVGNILAYSDIKSAGKKRTLKKRKQKKRTAKRKNF